MVVKMGKLLNCVENVEKDYRHQRNRLANGMLAVLGERPFLEDSSTNMQTRILSVSLE